MELLCRKAYAPAPGRLAAAIATISDKRRPIRDRVDRSNELNCCIIQIPQRQPKRPVARNSS
jgi:hypothetical protein